MCTVFTQREHKYLFIYLLERVQTCIQVALGGMHQQTPTLETHILNF